MSPPQVSFEACVFDLDGTLVATDRYWIAAARAATGSVLEELGIEGEIPAGPAWMSIVGLPLDQGLALLLPEHDPSVRTRIGEACRREEDRLIRAGRACLMPGAAEVLEELHRQGVRIGIASNCGKDYLAGLLKSLEPLGRFVEEPRCLDSPGVGDKADMLHDLTLTFGTRSAVMVGDHRSDREAAQAVGLPFVFCSFGFGDPRVAHESEAVLDTLPQLLPVLGRRAEWIRSALERLGLSAASRELRPRILGVTGSCASGKSLFARDAAAILTDTGVPMRAVSTEVFPSKAHAAAPEADPLGHAVDVEALLGELVLPVARGEAVASERGGGFRIEAGEGLILEGAYLLDPRLRPRLDRVLHLAVSEETSLRRVAGRDVRLGGPEALMEVRSRTLPAQRAFDRRFDPEVLADLVLPAETPLGPVRRTGRPPPTG